MKGTSKHSVVLKELLNQNDYSKIKNLQRLCSEYDKTELKLELEYKISRAGEKTGPSSKFNEFMHFVDDQLVGYLGICQFGGQGSTLEVNGMVHPDFRKNGIFNGLYRLVLDEFRKREAQRMLLLSDAASQAGQAFLKEVAEGLDHTEYEMYLSEIEHARYDSDQASLQLRKAFNKDASEIAFQNSIYFGDKIDGNDLPLPEDEEKRGMEIYIAELQGTSIGKVHIEADSGTGAIYGLGILPEYRGKGFGRQLLQLAIGKLKEKGLSKIKLQVVVKNTNALKLYQSCGFEICSTMDYYFIDKRE